jgi:hypothetical protein
MSNEWVQVDDAANDGFQSAAGWSTVGQRKQRPSKRFGRCKAKNDTCKGWHTQTSEFCAGHERAAKAQAKAVAAVAKGLGFREWLTKVSVA